ncbi:olfactory receptor 2AT4-like [Mugil cephalus]|uniref:olfactory receptor 2AT4-like n=1 Tax=Mugil cephalus TaxID=48193 RepID=UPI001FB67050|nr:olfactory receptor 2AT4-like [Mugil cephalus]
MDGEVNITYITLGGHVELETYGYLYFTIMFIAYIVIVSFNFIIVYLIWTEKTLHEPMYIFIAALLINSVVFSTNIYPKFLIDILSEKQVISYSACLLQFFIVYCFACSEFLLLAAMSYDRYVSICKPLQYPAIMTKERVSIFLVFAWTVPACVIAVPAIMSADMKICNFTLNGIFCNNSIYNLHCVSSVARSVFGAVALIVTALFPLLFILFTYTRILIITSRCSKEVRKKAAETCLPHLLVLVSYTFLCGYDVIIVRLGSDFPKIVSFIMTLQAILYHPLLNPIIYGLKMKEISKRLKRLFSQTKVI